MSLDKNCPSLQAVLAKYRLNTDYWQWHLHPPLTTTLNIELKRKDVKLTKCLQLNLQHSRMATANLTHILLHNNIDIAFVQEPYTLLNKVAGFPKDFKVFTWGRDRIRSAIIINNNDLDVIAITQLSHEDAILTEFRYEGLQFYGDSLYLPIDKDIERDLGSIDKIIRLTKGEGLLLALDSNARRKILSDTHTKAREEKWRASK